MSGLSNAMNGASLKFTDTSLVQQYANSLKGLNLQQAQLALSSKILSEQQKEQILVQAGLKASEDAIQAELLQTTLAEAGLSAEKQKSILVELGLMSKETEELFTQKACTQADLEAVLAQELKNGADAKGIISALGLSGANAGLTVSFGTLTKAIWANIAAMAKWLVTNPLGWVILGAGAIYGLVKGIDALTESTEEAGEAATAAKERYNEIESEIDSLNSKIKENDKLIAETNGDAQYDGYRKRLEAENKELERQIELERIKAQEAKAESDGKETKALTSKTYEYDVKHTVNATGAGYTTTSQKGNIATATDWYLDQAEATGVVSDKLKDYIETIKEQRENLDLLNPESKELYDNLGLLIDRYIALYPNVKVTSDEMADSSGNANKMTVSLSEMKTASDNISSLSSAFKELSDDGYLSVETISKIQEATKLSGDEWESYKLKLLNAKDGSVEFNQIMSEMTYKILDATFKKEGLVDATEDEIAAVLRENGVSNASAVAHDYLTRTISSEEKAKAENSIRTRLLSGDIAGLIENLSSEATACGLTEAAFKNLAIQMVLTNDTKMSFDDQIANLKALGVAAEITAAKMAGVNGYRNTKYSEKRNARGNMDSRGGLITNVGQETINGSTYIVYYGENGQVVDKEKIGVDYDNITVPNVTPNYSGATSGGKSGSNDAPDYEDPTDAIINRINLRAKELEQQEESIQNAIEIAELEKDHKKQISLTNDKLDVQRQKVDALKTANDELHQMAEDLRNSTPDWNEEEWFDSQGNATEAYNTLYNNSSKEDQEKIKDQFEKISKIKEAWTGNADEIVAINKEILQSEEDIWDIRRQIFDDRLEESEDYIEHSNNFGWENGDSEVKARKRVLEWIQSDYYKSLIKDDEEYYKILEENRLKYNDTLKEMTDDLLSEFQAKLDETYDIRISRLNSKSSLLSSHFGVVNAIAEEQHNLNKELREAETIGARMSALERETLFSKSDHNRLSSKLSDIMFDINDLQSDYLRDLEHATEDTIEEVTNQYERQYELKMKEYEVVKAELNLIKKRQILENTQNEKSVRTWNGSEWIYEANLQDVLNAQEEVENAKHELARAQSEEAQQTALNAIDASADALQTEKNKLTSAIEDMAEKMSGSGKEITSMLQTLAETDLPTFDAIIKAFGDSIKEVANISDEDINKYRSDSVVLETMKARSNAWLTANESERTALAEANRIDGERIGLTRGNDGVWRKKDGSRAYASGTSNAKKGWGLFDDTNKGFGSEVILTNDGILTQFNGGERVFSPEMADRLWEMAQKNNILTASVPQLDFSKLVPIEERINNAINNISNVSGDTYMIKDVQLSEPEGGEIKGFINFLKRKVY